MISDSNPVFVKIERYKEIIELIQVIDKKISAANQMLSELEEIRHKEDEEIATWQRNISDVEHKMQAIRDQLEQ